MFIMKTISSVFQSQLEQSDSVCYYHSVMLVQSSRSPLVCVLCKGATAGTCHRDGCAVSSLLLPNDGLPHLSSPFSSFLLPHPANHPNASRSLVPTFLSVILSFCAGLLHTSALLPASVSSVPSPLYPFFSLLSSSPLSLVSSSSSSPLSSCLVYLGSHETLIACKSKRCRCD